MTITADRAVLLYHSCKASDNYSAWSRGLLVRVVEFSTGLVRTVHTSVSIPYYTTEYYRTCPFKTSLCHIDRNLFQIYQSNETLGKLSSAISVIDVGGSGARRAKSSVTTYNSGYTFTREENNLVRLRVYPSKTIDGITITIELSYL